MGLGPLCNDGGFAGGGGALPMVHVCDREFRAAVLASQGEQFYERDGIGAAGDGGQ